LLVGDLLRQWGHDVLLIEAGSRDYPNRSLLPGEDDPNESYGAHQMNADAAPAQNVARTDTWRHQLLGANGWWARAHAVGGRGNLWGGWLSRFGPRVFTEGGWPYGPRALAPHYDHAERWLGALRGELVPRFANLRNELGVRVEAGVFATRLGPGLDSPLAHSVQTHTIATKLETGAARCALQVLVNGRPHTLLGRKLILAASPIETARLLLESGHCHPEVGRGLTDHSMLGYVLYEPNRQPVRLAGPVARPTAFIPRFVNLGESGARRYKGGFSVELMGPFPTSHASALQREALGIRPNSPGSVTYINAIGEQWRHPDRYLDLAPRALDAVGRRLPRVRFAWSSQERRMVAEMKTTCRQIAAVIASPGAELVRCRDPFVHPAIYHPAGTCAMGREANRPCDANGAVRDLPNVWIADASVFPSGGDAHPTLSVLAHAGRVARAVHRSLARAR
jgi:choline dehydrogenase-like flavoprotein